MICEWQEFSEIKKVTLNWERSDEPFFPFSSKWKGHKLLLRLNDFPAEPILTLFVDGKKVFDLEEWPTCWTKANCIDG